MNLGRFAALAVFVFAMICLASVAPVDAAPAQPVRGLAAAAPSVGFERVDCHYCVRHVHRRRYVRRYEPDYVAPVYPAPPVGLTFRKLFDAGFF